MPTSAAGLSLLAKLKKIALGFPEASEVLNHGRPAFAVGEKSFVMFMDDHHGVGFIALWCKAPPGEQADMVERDPQRYFVPPYVGPRGWIGVRLDVGKTDWKTIAMLVGESYRMTAPKRLLARSASAASPRPSVPTLARARASIGTGSSAVGARAAPTAAAKAPRRR